MEECVNREKANKGSTDVLLFAYLLFGLNNFIRLQRGVLALVKYSAVGGEGVGLHSFPYTNHGTTLRYIVIF